MEEKYCGRNRTCKTFFFFFLLPQEILDEVVRELQKVKDEIINGRRQSVNALGYVTQKRHVLLQCAINLQTNLGHSYSFFIHFL